jgi:hypothetical protein
MGAKIQLDTEGKLTVVNFAHLKITDDDLARLPLRETITHMHLEGTQITDAAIDHIANLSSLRLVNVGDTDVTLAGRQRLRKTLKKATIFPLDPGASDDSDPSCVWFEDLETGENYFFMTTKGRFQGRLEHMTAHQLYVTDQFGSRITIKYLDVEVIVRCAR